MNSVVLIAAEGVASAYIVNAISFGFVIVALLLMTPEAPSKSAAVQKREPLIKMDVELERFDATIKDEMNHPGLAKLGLGDVDDARLKTGIDILVDADKLPRTPKVEEIFTREFLPPKSERPTKLIDAKG